MSGFVRFVLVLNANVVLNGHVFVTCPDMSGHVRTNDLSGHQYANWTYRKSII